MTESELEKVRRTTYRRTYRYVRGTLIIEIVVRQDDDALYVIGIHRTDVEDARGGLDRTDLMNAVGVTAIREMFRKITEDYPQVTKITGYRASGQRRFISIPIRRAHEARIR